MGAVVVGIGMMTPVGLSAGETDASVRAGLARFSETDFRDRRFDRITLAEVPDDGLPALDESVGRADGLTAREERMLRLAAPPLRECLAPLGGRRGPVALCLALPETATTRPTRAERFLDLLGRQSGGAIAPAQSDATHAGRAGGLIAVGQAVATIEAGVADVVVAGGVDSYRDPYVLGTLDLEERLKSRAAPKGFVPGEGAAFLAIASEDAAARAGWRVFARVSAVALGFEEGHQYSAAPYRGDGLAATFARLAALGAVPEPVGHVYSSMNGEQFWAKEWGVAVVRNRALFRDDHDVAHPADCVGDTGAASGPLMLGLAARRTARPDARPALVYGSSDRGARAALVVSALH